MSSLQCVLDFVPPLSCSALLCSALLCSAVHCAECGVWRVACGVWGQSLRNELDGSQKSHAIASRELERLGRVHSDKCSALEAAQRELQLHTSAALDTKLHLERRIEALEALLAAKAKDYDGLQQKLLSERNAQRAKDEAHDSEVKGLQQKTADLGKRCDALMASARDYEIRVTEYKQQLQSKEWEKELAAVQHKYEQSVDEKAGVELQLKKALMEVEQSSDAQRRAVEARDRAMAEANALRTANLKLESKLDAQNREKAARYVRWNGMGPDLLVCDVM
jgi:hypothetical protein